MKKIILMMNTVLLLASACSQKETPAAKEKDRVAEASDKTLSLTAEQLANAGVVTGKVSRGTMKTILKLKGITELPPQGVVSIYAPMGGYLRQTSLLQGKMVRKGELLAVLEDPQYIQLQQDYLNAVNQLQLAESEYNRQKLLFESRSSSEKILQQAEMTYRNAKVAVTGLREKLNLIGIVPAAVSADNISSSIRIMSPVNGYVTKVNANIGKYVQPTEPLFELVNLSGMYLVLDAFEKDLPDIQPGVSLVAYTNQAPEKKYAAKVSRLQKKVSDARTVAIYCDFVGGAGNIIPGTYMNAELEVSSSNRLLIPEAALVTHENGQYVFVRENEGSFRMEKVEVGGSEGGMAPIESSGLDEGSDIVVQGAYWLLMQLENMHSME